MTTSQVITLNIKWATANLFQFSFDFNAHIAAVTVVPTFAQIASDKDAIYEICQVASAVIIIAIVAQLDWITTVAIAQTKT